MLFESQTFVSTKGVINKIEQAEILELLDRHFSGDFGNISEPDRLSNEKALTDHNDMIMSSYVSKEGCKIWIITEADRSLTTVLLPEEY